MSSMRDYVKTFQTLYTAIIYLIVIAGNGQSVCWMKAVLVVTELGLILLN